MLVTANAVVVSDLEAAVRMLLVHGEASHYHLELAGITGDLTKPNSCYVTFSSKMDELLGKDS